MNISIAPENGLCFDLDTQNGSYIYTTIIGRECQNLPILPCSYGYFIAGSKHFTERHQCAENIVCQLFLTHSGKGKFYVDGKEYIAGPKSVVLLPFLTPHRYETYGDSWVHEWVNFSGSACETFYNLINQDGFNVYVWENSQRIEQLFRDIRNGFQIQDVPGIVHTSTRILCALDALYDYIIDCRRHSSGNSYENIIRAARYIDEHYNEELTLDKLAQIAYLSKYYFTRLFHSYSGMSPHDYICAVRISHAKQMLITTNLSIGEIGWQCGFTGSNSFVRRFRESTGTTPGAFRKNAGF